ncbi:hypothetical protein [Frigoriflavimonas asaccharolytica]|uniref:MoxR-vWA-beta-propeller ternary system domain-containing protein n=1 Tax=Frigoriflavimonas asaccharolytica TaxID=2735899 RepID=A0A8J8GA07_9FLAO|nr:hypothetical protein [Frigoriflavimonas asaccharolytica]NRS93651.1 hypothetical protein [Frigoriflavimonas asaccharolytica]
MAKNTENSLKEYFAVLPREKLKILGNIRHWENVQVSSDGEEIWLKNFSQDQAFSPILKIIPDVKIYELREGLLFEIGKSVPSRKLSSGLLWNSLQMSINIELPAKNLLQNNVAESFTIKIIPSEIEKESNVLIISLEDLDTHISSIPEFRQAKLHWVIADEKVILLGAPMISLPGKTYWQNGNHFLPSGYDFQFSILSQEINYKLNSENQFYIFWKKDGRYFLIEKQKFMPLSISSFRKTKLIL